MASFANMLHVKLPAGEFTDSRNYFSTFTGKESLSRVYNIEQPVDRGALAIVKNGWKYITPSNGPALMKEVNIETGYSNEDQLYNLKDDPKELTNLALTFPGKVKELKALLEKTKAEK